MKKHRKTGERETKNSGCSQPSTSATAKFTKWLLIFGIITCIVIAGLGLIKHFSDSDEKIQGKESPSSVIEQPVPSTVLSKLTPEQEIANLKKEELELTELLVGEFPNSEVALVLMGNVYRKQGKSNEAVKCWEKALYQNPERPDAYNGMGWISIERGEYEKAIKFWRKALEVNPKMRSVHSSIAQAFMALGKYEEVIEEAEEELKISPQSALSHFLLGQGYLKQKQHEKAKQYYEKAIELQPDNMNAYYGLFTVCSRLKLQDEAKEYMATFRKLKSKDRKVLMDRNKAFDDLVKIRKGVAETYGDAEKLYWNKGDLQQAEKMLQRAISLDPNNTEFIMKMGSLFQMRNQLPDALQIYEKVREMEPDNIINHMNIGVLSMQLNRFADAKKAFQTAVTLAPKFSGGYRELAQLYLKTGTKFSEALKLAEKAVALEETAANYFILSWAYDKNGDVASARSALKRATQLDPDNLEYRRMYELIQKRDKRSDS